MSGKVRAYTEKQKDTLANKGGVQGRKRRKGGKDAYQKPWRTKLRIYRDPLVPLAPLLVHLGVGAKIGR